jgi:hypothetical protein
MIQKYFFPALTILIFLSSCASADKSWIDLKAKKINSNAANQTVNYSVDWVSEATLVALDRMDIMIISDDSSPSQKSIKAVTIDLDILIELSSLSPNSTQMKINIKYPKDHKTKTTANEIFYQTRQLLLSYKPPE